MLEEGLPGLHAADSYRGHQNPIFAMSYGWHLNFILQSFFYLDAISFVYAALGCCRLVYPSFDSDQVARTLSHMVNP
jgi:hypothetical protein